MIAALYVERGGVYWDLPDVDPWDEARDARLYAGPWPVVAHPPCARWSQLAHIHKARIPIGDDGGCFEAALAAVRTYGGVLEHPALSMAWDHFDLPLPARYGWQSHFGDEGWATEIDQGAFGHPAQKRTWLYAVGIGPAQLNYARVRSSVKVENMSTRSYGPSRTPEPFRDVLLAMARSVSVLSVCGALPEHAQGRPREA